MPRPVDAQVVIVGGGPVGLTAAADLDSRGIKSVVIERRRFLEAPNVKCNHISARTMERFRVLGVGDKIRQAGLPADYPHDVTFKTTFTGRELGRIPIPSRAERWSSKSGPDTTWQTPEPPHRVNQRFFEPVLMEHVAALPNVTLLTQTEYLGAVQDNDSVTVEVQSGGEVFTITGKYLIGADGGKSKVRKEIGASFSGDPVLSHVQSTWIRAQDLYELAGGQPAWSYYTFNPQRNGHVYAIDGHSEFLVHNYLTEEEAEAGNVDRDESIRAILGVDDEFTYDIISEQDWVARRLIANTFRKERMFIAGDASHLWVPYAGYGMNAGIADVLNLTWCLGGVFAGWASDEILDAYEIERKPVTEAVSHLVKGHMKKINQADVPANIEDDSPAGEVARVKLGAAAYELNVQQFAAEGLNFGYSYSDSPIIWYDDEAPPEFSMGQYTPSTVPGCRAPHFYMADGESLYDRLGKYFTLITTDSNSDEAGKLLDAFARARVPIELVVVSAGALPPTYTHTFTIVREDQHVVWRGNSSPDDFDKVVAHLCGR